MATVLVLEDKTRAGLLNVSDILLVHDYDVLLASSPSELLAKAASGPVDGLVLDVNHLGGKPAVDLVAELYRVDGFKPAPILFVVDDEEQLKQRLAGLPFNQIETLSRPFDMDGLLDRVQKVLERKRILDPSNFEVGAVGGALKESALPPPSARHPVAPPAGAAASQPAAAASASAGGQTVLIVEDTYAIRRVLKKYVENAGYQTLEAEDGVEAVGKVSNNKVDLILLDIMLPKLDGFSVLEILKSDPRHRKIPVILCTAKNAKEDVIRGKKLGAEGYIVKPFSADTLREKMKQVLAGGG